MKFIYGRRLRNIDKARMIKMMGFIQKKRKTEAMNAIYLAIFKGCRIIAHDLCLDKIKLDLRRTNHKIIHKFFPNVKEIAIIYTIQINGKRECQNPNKRGRHLFNFKEFAYVVIYRKRIYILTRTNKIEIFFVRINKKEKWKSNEF